MSTARVTQMPTAQSGATQELTTLLTFAKFPKIWNPEMAKGSSTTWRTAWIGSSREHILTPVIIISKADFLAGTLEKLAKVLPNGAELHTEHVLVSGDWAVVELHSLATAKNGFRFDNRYCWVCRFVNGAIV